MGAPRIRGRGSDTKGRRATADRRSADNRLRVDEAAADGVARERDAVAEAELLEDVRSVAFHGLLADREHLPDLTARVAFGDQLDDLGLARRERVAVALAAGI